MPLWSTGVFLTDSLYWFPFLFLYQFSAFTFSYAIYLCVKWTLNLSSLQNTSKEVLGCQGFYQRLQWNLHLLQKISFSLCQIWNIEPTAVPSFLSLGLPFAVPVYSHQMILASLVTHKQASLSQQRDAGRSFLHFLFSQGWGLQKHLNQHKSRARPVLSLSRWWLFSITAHELAHIHQQLNNSMAAEGYIGKIQLVF